MEEALKVFLPDMQPRWYKGMASVISTNAIVSVTFIEKKRCIHAHLIHCNADGLLLNI